MFRTWNEVKDNMSTETVKDALAIVTHALTKGYIKTKQGHLVDAIVVGDNVRAFEVLVNPEIADKLKRAEETRKEIEKQRAYHLRRQKRLFDRGLKMSSIIGKLKAQM